MFDLRNKKTWKTISLVIVIILAIALVVPTILWALQGV